MYTPLTLRKKIAALLIFSIVCGGIPASVLAQTVTAGGSQPGGSLNPDGGILLSDFVQDSVGAVAAAGIACNKTKIQTGIRKMFGLAAKDAAKKAADAARKAADKAAKATGSTAPDDQLVHLEETSDTAQNIEKAANAAEVQAIKFTCLNKIERAAIGVILRQITLSTVNWINHGFNGNPIYSTDTSQILKNIGDKTLRDFNNTFGFDTRNYPFGRNFVKSLLTRLHSDFEQSSKYTLNAVIAQRYPGLTDKDYAMNFSNGGWAAFNAQFSLGNDPLGFRLTAQDVLASRMAGTSYSPTQDIKDALQRSGGFLDIKTCVDKNYNPNADTATTKAAYSAAADKADAAAKLAAAKNAEDFKAADDLAAAQKSGDAAAIASAQAALDQADKASADANAALGAANSELAAADAADAKVSASTECNAWKTRTPGSIVADSLKQTLNIHSNQLINGQDLSTDITAIFNALSNQLINKGLSSLSTSDTNPNFTKNSAGVTITSSTSINDSINPGGSWSTSGSNFNIFTDIPTVMRNEDNTTQPITDSKQKVSGCTEENQTYNAVGQYCTGDTTLPEGYQQIVTKEILAEQRLIESVYVLDYCIPGPHPGWQNEIEPTAQSFISNPKLFPASAGQSDVKKVLATYGSAIGNLFGLAAGVVAGALIPAGTTAAVTVGATTGSIVPGLGTAIGAIVGLALGTILTEIGTNKDTTNEQVYGPIMQALLGVGIEFGTTTLLGSYGGGKEHVNGHDNAGNIITVLAPRYKKAMMMTYAPTERDVDASQDISDKEFPLDGSTSPYTYANPYKPPVLDVGGTPPSISGIPDLSTSSYTRAIIEKQGYNAFDAIGDVTMIDATEFPLLQNYRDAITQQQIELNTSRATNAQLHRLLARIDGLTSQKGYPGLNGALDSVPTIKLNGSPSVTVSMGTIYSDAGATAYDPSRGADISQNITVSNNVNTRTPGIYTITYDVKNRDGISGNQVTRTVKVLDETGQATDIITNSMLSNSAIAGISSLSGISFLNDTTTSQGSGASTVRDYNTDLKIVKNISNHSLLSDYEMELLRISNTFDQLAPYIHGTDDLRSEQAAYDAIQNKIMLVDGGKDDRKGGAINECITETSENSRFVGFKGPLYRVAFNYLETNEGTTRALPKWITDKLPASESFLPDWHWAQGNEQQLTDKDAHYDFFNGEFDGHNMHGAGKPTAVSGSVTLDLNKLIYNDDIVTIKNQPINNAIVGLEHVLGIY